MKIPGALAFSLVLGALNLGLTACSGGSTFPDTGGTSVGVGGANGDSSGIGGSWEPLSPTTTSGYTGFGGAPTTWEGLPASDGDCSKPTQYVYLIDTARVMWRFWPPTLELTEIGKVVCNNGGLTAPFSMAIDRHGTAWILDYSGLIFKLDLDSGACFDTGYKPVPAPAKFSLFGMAFTADSMSPDKETLFVRDGIWAPAGQEPAARALGRFDLTSKKITPIADNPGEVGDLSGTGDGRLYNYRRQGDSGTELAEIDTKTGANLAVVPLGEMTFGSSFALAVAAWGGDVWMFTDEANASSKITRYRTTTGQFDVVKTDIGPHIIGAGVSSCAPLVTPK